MSICANCRGSSLLGRAHHMQNAPETRNLTGNNATTDQPSSSQTAYIVDHAIPTLLGDLHDVDTKLADLRAVVDALEAEREALEKALTHFHFILSPFYRIPVEIISEIVFYTVGYASPMETGAPHWQLARVSKAWHTAVASCHAIWSNIHLNFADKHSEGDLMRLITALSCSGITPLTVDVGGDVGQRITAHTEKVHATMLNQLFYESARWRMAEISDVHCIDRMLITHRCRFPLLKSLSISIPVGLSYDQSTRIGGFSFSPLLTELSYLGGPRPLDIAYRQLTTLRMLENGWHGWSHVDLRKMISQCTSLVHFECILGDDINTWRLVGADGSNSRVPIRITCAARVLHCDNSDAFLWLAFPDVEEVVLYNKVELFVFDAAMRFSGAQSLTELHLVDFAFRVARSDFLEDTLLRTLRGLSNLITLIIDVAGFDFELDHSLSPGGTITTTAPSDVTTAVFFQLGSPLFLPRLVSLSLFSKSSAFKEHYTPILGLINELELEASRARQRLFIDILRQRWYGDINGVLVSRLEKYFMYADVYFDPEEEDVDAVAERLLLPKDIHDLKELRRDGMNLRIGFSCGWDLTML